MVTKKQIEKQFADELATSKAKGPLLHAIYALSNDPTLAGKDLATFEGYRGKRPSGTQIARARMLLGIKTGSSKRAAKKSSRKSPARRSRKGQAPKNADSLLMDAFRSYQRIIEDADHRKNLAQERFKAEIASIDEETKEARAKVKQLLPLIENA